MKSLSRANLSLARFLPLAAGLAVLGWVALALDVAGAGPAATAVRFARSTAFTAPNFDAKDFDEKIRPILSNNCFKCHGPDMATRQGRGPAGRGDGLRLDTQRGLFAANDRGRAAVVAGSPEMSEIIRRIESDDPDLRMPPPEVSQHGLTVEQVALMRAWIEAGAPWGEHWSYAPLAPLGPPAPTGSRIDELVDARLASEGLTRSPPAERRALLRRVSLDLIGLPPTLDELAAWETDQGDGAFERAVDRLLASPRFGEKWARWWLDLARYADTQGYEKDSRRTVWPYRDWVIRVFNADMPLNDFAKAQLAGDLLPRAGDDDLLATAFHRQTMTNDEGGTDDEEFRVAAVIDRVNTTMEVFQATTIACVQCHAHKFDPFTHEDFYRLLAIFNNTADTDRPDDAPTVRVAPAAIKARIAELDSQIAVANERRVQAALATLRHDAPQSPPPLAGPQPRYWIDDVLPAGAKAWTNDVLTPWPWWQDETGLKAAHGERFFKTTYPATGQCFVTEAHPALSVGAGESLVCSVRIDPLNPPRAIMLQWLSVQKGWSHRAYWGEGVLPWDKEREGTGARRRMGDLPTPGEWVTLTVSAKDVDLEGLEVSGWAFSQFGGTVWWDGAGVVSEKPLSDEHRRTVKAWAASERGRTEGAVPGDVRAVINKDHAGWNQEEQGLAERYWALSVSAAGQSAAAPFETTTAMLTARRAALLEQGADVPVMRELAGSMRRTSHVFVRGSFLDRGPEVTPGVPEVLRTASGGADAHDRAALADWLFDDRNPLTARVLANRVWEQLFGTGIVETVEDFGVQGAWPSHPALLDHLGASLRDGVGGGVQGGPRWSLKALLREIVLSGTYRQSSALSPDRAERDPAGRLLSRFPRVRLDGETIRDVSLTASGLLSDAMYGPPVFPPQPAGLWTIIYSGDDWATSTGPDRYRRALYTFWRRTVPHPLMATFDAPTREVCVSRRIRTNTPLQALVTLNDPAFVEAAQALARRALSSMFVDDRARTDLIFNAVLARPASAAEHAVVVALLARERARFAQAPADAERAACDPLGPLPAGLSAAEAASWTAVAGVVLNLDEALVKE